MWYNSTWGIIGIAVVIIGIIWLLSWLFSTTEESAELPTGRQYEVKARERGGRSLFLVADRDGTLVLTPSGTRRTAWSFPKVSDRKDGIVYNMETGTGSVRIRNNIPIVSGDTSTPPAELQLKKMGDFIVIRTLSDRWGYMTTDNVGNVRFTNDRREAIRFDINPYLGTPAS